MSDGMTEKEMISILIDNYISLQRLEKAEDRQTEIDNQKRVLKAKLESFGIITSELDLK